MTHTTAAGGRKEQIEGLSLEDMRLIDRAWETHKSALPVATVIDDNQPGRTAIIQIDIDPPTLPVGSRLYGQPKAVGAESETALLRALQAIAGTEVVSVRQDHLVETINTMRAIARAAIAKTGGA